MRSAFSLFTPAGYSCRGVQGYLNKRPSDARSWRALMGLWVWGFRLSVGRFWAFWGYVWVGGRVGVGGVPWVWAAGELGGGKGRRKGARGV